MELGGVWLGFPEGIPPGPGAAWGDVDVLSNSGFSSLEALVSVINNASCFQLGPFGWRSAGARGVQLLEWVLGP